MSNINLQVPGYTVGKPLGKGSFGEVVSAVNNATGAEVAIKTIPLHTGRAKKSLLHTREIASLRKMVGRPNIVQLLDCVRTPETVVLVMEKLDCTLLERIKAHIDSNTFFRDEEVTSLVRQTLNGLQYIHAAGLVHRDLKPENILMSGERVCISDFGLVRDTAETIQLTEYISTRWYRAPEILLKSRSYSYAVDIWALGCVLYETLMLKPLFPGETELDQIFRIMGKLGSPYESERDPICVEFNNVSRCGNTEFFWTTREENLSLYGGGIWKDGFYLASSMGIKLPMNMSPKNMRDEVPTVNYIAVDLICNMLRYDPSHRPTAAIALFHPWLNTPGSYNEDRNTHRFMSSSTSDTYNYGDISPTMAKDEAPFSPSTIFVPDIDSLNSDSPVSDQYEISVRRSGTARRTVHSSEKQPLKVYTNVRSGNPGPSSESPSTSRTLVHDTLSNAIHLGTLDRNMMNSPRDSGSARPSANESSANFFKPMELQSPSLSFAMNNIATNVPFVRNPAQQSYNTTHPRYSQYELKGQSPTHATRNYSDYQDSPLESPRTCVIKENDSVYNLGSLDGTLQRPGGIQLPSDTFDLSSIDDISHKSGHYGSRSRLSNKRDHRNRSNEDDESNFEYPSHEFIDQDEFLKRPANMSTFGRQYNNYTLEKTRLEDNSIERSSLSRKTGPGWFKRGNTDASWTSS